MAESTTKLPQSAETPAWHEAYPVSKVPPEFISREEVLSLIRDEHSIAGRNYVLVDLRRHDHAGGTIKGSLNLPAQSLWSSLPVLYTLFREAGVKQVIWYCGSSKGRGCRAGSWFSEHISRQGDNLMQSLVLRGGIKGWVKGGAEFVNEMDEYEQAAWTDE